MSATSTGLFTPLPLRSVTLRNRIAVSPMCQYSSQDGFANDWHLVHLGSRAAGGAGLVIVEATAVDARGRISPADMGLWKDEHVEPLARIAAFLKRQGAAAGIQIAHAGRKASTRPPQAGEGVLAVEQGGWRPVAPSARPFQPTDPPPEELSKAQIGEIVDAFAAAALRARRAGFQVLEIHAAHGYLIHEFLSPLSNRRGDEYGGGFSQRVRFALEVVEAVRAVWPPDLPLFMRVSATDWVPGGWNIEETVELARLAGGLGVDLIDCSSGALSPLQQIPVAPGYQVPFAERVRRETGLKTAAVGLITTPQQADEIVRSGKADLILLAREFLRNPYFPLHAARALGEPFPPPVQYARGF